MVLQLLSRLKIQHVAFAAIFLCFILVNADKIHDPDMWWHLKAGEYIFENQTVPKTDFYSFSNTGHPWIAHEWGSELLYYLAYKVWNFRGLFIANLIFLSFTYFIMGRYTYMRCGRDLSLTTGIMIIITVFSSLFWVFRPHLLAYLFFILYIYVLEAYARGRNWLWLLPPLMILWVNMHGSFIMGIVLLCIYLFSGLIRLEAGKVTARKWEPAERKNLLIMLFLVTAAVMVNPNTVEMYYYPFFTLNSEAIVENITEWASPDFHIPIFKAFLAYLFTVYAVLIASKRQVQLRDILMLGLFTYLAMFGVRNIALFMFVTGPMLAEHLSGFIPAFRPQKQLLSVNWVILGIVMIFGFQAFPPQTTVGEQVNGERFPYKAVEYMKQHQLNGSVFNDYTWGGYLIWTRYPENQVVIDGRADIYEDQVLPDYMRIIKVKPDAYELLLKYNPRFILITPEAPLNHLIKAGADWREIYRDKLAVLYLKNN